MVSQHIASAIEEVDSTIPSPQPALIIDHSMSPSSAPDGVVCSSSSQGGETRVFECGCGKCTFMSFIENGCPTPRLTQSSLPYLNPAGLTEDEKELLIGRLLERSKVIRFAFQRLVTATSKSLRQQGISTVELIETLMALGAIDPVYASSEASTFDRRVEELISASSTVEIFVKIRDYLSFFNIGVIEHVIAELGTDKDRANLDAYKLNLDEYCKHLVFECPPLYGTPGRSDHTRVVVKLDVNLEKYTLNELREFRSRLTKILHLTEHALQLESVEKGCVELTFQLASRLKEQIFPLSLEQEAALQHEKIVMLACEDYLCLPQV